MNLRTCELVKFMTSQLLNCELMKLWTYEAQNFAAGKCDELCRTGAKIFSSVPKWRVLVQICEKNPLREEGDEKRSSNRDHFCAGSSELSWCPQEHALQTD